MIDFLQYLKNREVSELCEIRVIAIYSKYSFQEFEIKNPTEVSEGILREMDILLTKDQEAALMNRKSIDHSTYRWPDGKNGWPLVPYVISDSMY